MSEVKNCPKCGGEMAEDERFLFPFVIMAEEPGDKTILFFCKNCGYIELYKEMKAQALPPSETPLGLSALTQARIEGVIETVPPPLKQGKKNEETHDVRSQKKRNSR